MPPGSSVCSGQGPGWAGLRAQDRGQERALGEARIGARSQQGARQRFPRAADSPAESQGLCELRQQNQQHFLRTLLGSLSSASLRGVQRAHDVPGR